MNFLGFGQSAEIDIVFDGADNRKMVEVKTEDGKKEKMFLYYDGETVKGKVNVTLKKPGSKLEHQGIKIELIGQIELFYDRGNHHEFTSLVKELARPGDLIQNTSYPFEFTNVEKPFEVYGGANVRLRYFLRVTIVRRLSDIVREVDIAVHTLCSYPDLNNPIKMEVGIEDCLHIEFEYNKSKYHLKDVIVGKIYFLLVRIKIKHMEIAIIKRETTGSGPNIFTENDTIAKYEIMDGAPVKGESIPIRVFLAGYDLTPTMRDINKKFSVKYFLNLVLMDTEDRRYFKQQEITLWRKADKNRKSQPQSVNNPHVPTHLVGGPDNNMKSMISTTVNTTVEDEAQAEGDMISGISSSNIKNQSFGGDSNVGLFVRENPQVSMSSDISNNPLTLSTGDSNTGLQRGVADGASSAVLQPDETITSGGSLFDIAASATSQQPSSNISEAPPSAAAAAAPAAIAATTSESAEIQTSPQQQTTTTTTNTPKTSVTHDIANSNSSRSKTQNVTKNPTKSRPVPSARTTIQVISDEPPPMDDDEKNENMIATTPAVVSSENKQSPKLTRSDKSNEKTCVAE